MTNRTLLHPARRVLLLALMVLLTQMLAMMHGVIHAVPDSVRDQHEAGVVYADAQSEHAATEAGSAASWIKALFSAHEGQSDCRQYDQLNRDALPAGLVVVGVHVTPEILIVDMPRGEALARWAALFEARGPPLL